MKKLIYIIPLLMLLGCTSDYIEEPIRYNQDIDIFEVQSTTIKDGDTFKIKFDNVATYKLSLTDEFTNVTYTNEKFNSVVGENILTIFTKAIPKGSFIFMVKDSDDNIIKKTKVKI